MQSILVGLDLSPRAEVVLRTARELAERQGARLTLVAAVTIPVGYPPEAYTMDPFRLEVLLRKDAEERLKALARSMPAELVERIEVGTGVPWRVLCDAAKAHAADLIVVGSHGYDALDHLIGTTAAKVVNHALCSVLVVRPKAPAPPVK